MTVTAARLRAEWMAALAVATLDDSPAADAAEQAAWDAFRDQCEAESPDGCCEHPECP